MTCSRAFKIARLWILTAAVSAAIFWYFHAAVRPEQHAHASESSIRSGSLLVDGMRRSYLYYVPPKLPPQEPLLIVLHGSGQNAQLIRQATGREFETLADRDHFAVAYPNGYLGNWNDCRIAAPYPAHTHNVNDVAFINDVAKRMQAQANTDPRRVFVAGYSNGGQMAYRMALESPQTIDGIATIGANLPTPDNDSCQSAGKPVPTLVISGTKDPISPFTGGVETLFGRQSRGAVLSAAQTVQYFAQLAGQTASPRITALPHQKTSGVTSVSLTDYTRAGRPEVAWYIVQNGGHVIPGQSLGAPRRLGLVTHDLDAPSAVWSFFARQSSRPTA